MARGRKKENLTPEERLQAALVPESEQPYKIPENWCWTHLGKLYQINPKNLAEDFVDAAFIPMEKIAPGFVNEYSFDVQPWCKAKKGHTQFADGDVAFAKISPCFENRKSMLLNNLPNGIGGGTTELVILRQSHMNQKYTFWFISQEQFIRGGIATYSGTAGQQRISMDYVRTYPIPVPPLLEQQRIVDRIESLFAKLDEAKQKAQDALDSFESRKAAILHKAFTGELIGKPSTATTTLEEITTCIRIGPFGSALHKEDYILGGIPVVNPKHIIHQKIVPEEKITVSVQKAEELSSYILQENDIILGRRGDMGRSAPVTDLETGWLCGTGSMIIRLKSGYNAKFYSQIIASQAAVRYLEENSVGSTMKNLNEKIVRLLPIPDFTVDEQLKIVRILDNLLVKEQQAKEAAEKVLEQIDLIKKSILARAFRGELGTNDPTEQSAVELLRQVLSTSDM